MWKLLRLILLCFGFIGLLCVAEIIMSHSQPDVEFLPEISKCGDSWCYMGIEPGKTTDFNAQTILGNTPQLTMVYSPIGGTQDYEHYAKPPYKLRLFKSKTNVVDTINVIPDSTNLIAGKIILNFGSPCRVILEYPSIFLLYPGVSFQFILRGEQIEPFSTLHTIAFNSSSAMDCVSATNGPLFNYLWSGFRRYAPQTSR